MVFIKKIQSSDFSTRKSGIWSLQRVKQQMPQSTIT